MWSEARKELVAVVAFKQWEQNATVGSLYLGRPWRSLRVARCTDTRLPSGLLLGAGLVAYCATLLLLVSFASPYWLESYQEANMEFIRLGLWDVCFHNYRHPSYQYDETFNGCHWIHSYAYQNIRDWLLPASEGSGGTVGRRAVERSSAHRCATVCGAAEQHVTANDWQQPSGSRASLKPRIQHRLGLVPEPAPGNCTLAGVASQGCPRTWNRPLEPELAGASWSNARLRNDNQGSSS
ncbi:hypothetical protein HPB50_002485 [Hyalomma asiaticum]|uniref:Uncharacterized protein n=1 Tax=Hyalomma asiaticum TaxID=266040 RepID=A0ACB7SIH8_HYAAI|nr:hypothetical protein HPB50_002485 [Hyalomma asiaticum]